MAGRFVASATALLYAVVSATPAAAWFEQGHYMTAEVAWNGLNAHARCAVGKLLPLNPSYASWIANVPADQQAQIAFVSAADWADAIKTAGSGYQDDGYDDSVPAAANNLGYSDKLMHKYWHFVDTPFTTDGTPTHPAGTNNVTERIATFRTVLADSTATDDLKSYDLVWLLHLVGDVHQPLHASDRYSKTFPTGDVGGNLVKIGGGPQKVLHAYWDALPGDSTDPRVAIPAADALPPASPIVAGIDDPSIWANESFQLAQKTVYSKPVSSGAGPYKVYGRTYTKRARDVAMTRVALAGARLANLLNASLATYPCP
jgi:hypothetical protein